MGADGDLVATRLARGCRCFVAWVEGAVGGFGWLSTSPEWIGELQLEITPKPGEGYVWNCVTVQEHRRKGIFRSLLLGISQVARAEGLQRLWIGSVAIPAERAVGPAGFRPAMRFATVSVGGLHLLAVRPAEPALSLAASEVISIRPGLHVRRWRLRRH